jgi:hypothetical protein
MNNYEKYEEDYLNYIESFVNTEQKNDFVQSLDEMHDCILSHLTITYYNHMKNKMTIYKEDEDIFLFNLQYLARLGYCISQASSRYTLENNGFKVFNKYKNRELILLNKKLIVRILLRIIYKIEDYLESLF